MSQGMGMGSNPGRRLQNNRFHRLGAGCCRATEGIIGTDGGYMPEQMILDLNGVIPSVTSCRRACKSYGDACFGFEVDRHRGHGNFNIIFDHFWRCWSSISSRTRSGLCYWLHFVSVLIGCRLVLVHSGVVSESGLQAPEVRAPAWPGDVCIS